jgi:Fe-S-cluster containining protein
MGSILCEHCTAACCRYIALPIDKPVCARDYDDIRWYVMHEGISVFVEDGDWYIQILTRCKNLRPDNLCNIYASRPRICREYEPGECDYVDSRYSYELYFTHPQQVEEYFERKTGRKLAPASVESGNGRIRRPRRRGPTRSAS